MYYSIKTHYMSDSENTKLYDTEDHSVVKHLLYFLFLKLNTYFVEKKKKKLMSLS